MHEQRQSAGYVELIRGNRNFRYLWFSDVTSFLGDWFNTIAVYTLVRSLTDSPLALGAVLLTRLIPWGLAAPVAGLLVDRFDRRRLMIASDLCRAVVVLGFLLVDEPGHLPLLYGLLVAQVVFGSVYIPARSASIPNVTSKRELLTANALSAATWSTLLAVGAALGGLATEWLGLKWVFVIDSASYVISAFFVFRTVIPQSTDLSGAPKRVAAAFGEIVDGWRHMRRVPRIGRIALTKAAWALGGGAQVYMLTLVGEQIEPLAPAVGIGMLYAARGLGTGLGPIAARAWVPKQRHWPALIGLGIVSSGLFYVLAGAVPWSYALMVLVMLAHVPSGANWVVSTVLLQQRTEDGFRGRVFASEWMLLMLADSVSILSASLLLESGLLSLRQGIVAFACVSVVAGLLWIVLVVPRERREADMRETQRRTP
ncbi:MAG: MFS transporter [bacterium]|nr:MFS transporter [bacterium]